MLSTILQLFDKLLTMYREWSQKNEVKQVQHERKKEVEQVKQTDEKLKDTVKKPDPIDDLNSRFGWNPGVQKHNK